MFGDSPEEHDDTAIPPNSQQSNSPSSSQDYDLPVIHEDKLRSLIRDVVREELADHGAEQALFLRTQLSRLQTQFRRMHAQFDRVSERQEEFLDGVSQYVVQASKDAELALQRQQERDREFVDVIRGEIKEAATAGVKGCVSPAPVVVDDGVDDHPFAANSESVGSDEDTTESSASEFRLQLARRCQDNLCTGKVLFAKAYQLVLLHIPGREQLFSLSAAASICFGVAVGFSLGRRVGNTVFNVMAR